MSRKSQIPSLLVATIYDNGEPRRNRRVEWMLEGAGHIIEVDESGFFPKGKAKGKDVPMKVN